MRQGGIHSLIDEEKQWLREKKTRKVRDVECVGMCVDTQRCVSAGTLDWYVNARDSAVWSHTVRTTMSISLASCGKGVSIDNPIKSWHISTAGIAASSRASSARNKAVNFALCSSGNKGVCSLQRASRVVKRTLVQAHVSPFNKTREENLQPCRCSEHERQGKNTRSERRFVLFPIISYIRALLWTALTAASHHHTGLNIISYIFALVKVFSLKYLSGWAGNVIPSSDLPFISSPWFEVIAEWACLSNCLNWMWFIGKHTSALAAAVLSTRASYLWLVQADRRHYSCRGHRWHLPSLSFLVPEVHAALLKQLMKCWHTG